LLNKPVINTFLPAKNPMTLFLSLTLKYGEY
jgi:hypothetical protein